MAEPESLLKSILGSEAEQILNGPPAALYDIVMAVELPPLEPLPQIQREFFEFWENDDPQSFEAFITGGRESIPALEGFLGSTQGKDKRPPFPADIRPPPHTLQFLYEKQVISPGDIFVLQMHNHNREPAENNLISWFELIGRNLATRKLIFKCRKGLHGQEVTEFEVKSAYDLKQYFLTNNPYAASGIFSTDPWEAISVLCNVQKALAKKPKPKYKTLRAISERYTDQNNDGRDIIHGVPDDRQLDLLNSPRRLKHKDDVVGSVANPVISGESLKKW